MHLTDYYNIKIDIKVREELKKFYQNVYNKYKHIYSREDMVRFIDEYFSRLQGIKPVDLIYKPYLNKWDGLSRVRIGSWNFAIKTEGNTLHVVDACHSQNMSNHIPLDDGEVEEQTYVNPRITDIILRERRDNRFLIKCKIDAEEQLFEVVTDADSNLYRAKQITPEQLAEKYFKNALDQSIDLDHIVHFRR